jgi:2-dehydro-3-deoxy-D-arabinonate dehydratase
MTRTNWEQLLLRYFHPDKGVGFGIEIDGVVYDVSDQVSSLTGWLRSSVGRVPEAIDDLHQAAKATALTYEAQVFDNFPEPGLPHLLAPVDEQEVWAAGVTYARSRAARQEEAVDGGDVYDRVYQAARPELFFKAYGYRVVAPQGEVGIRHDAAWSVPEPELAVLLNPKMEVVGFSAGNDMSSRDIEGANPLYLPQAKIYDACCALGRGIRLVHRQTWPETTISMTITRFAESVFEGEIQTTEITRPLLGLVEHLGRCLTFPNGAVLLTGTGIVPPDDFRLQAGDAITIRIADVTTLTNTVKVV